MWGYLGFGLKYHFFFLRSYIESFLPICLANYSFVKLSVLLFSNIFVYSVSLNSRICPCWPLFQLTLTHSGLFSFTFGELMYLGTSFVGIPWSLDKSASENVHSFLLGIRRLPPWWHFKLNYWLGFFWGPHRSCELWPQAPVNTCQLALFPAFPRTRLIC